MCFQLLSPLNDTYGLKEEKKLLFEVIVEVNFVLSDEAKFCCSEVVFLRLKSCFIYVKMVFFCGIIYPLISNIYVCLNLEFSVLIDGKFLLLFESEFGI